MKEIKSEVNRSSIGVNIRLALWGVSAGRCEMCNRILFEDTAFGKQGNFAEDAHIHAVSKNGPRHVPEMTSEEKNDITNLMLLCAEHHHMIDTLRDEYEAKLLYRYKEEHEQRIREVTGIMNDQSCQMVSYFCNIDNQRVYSEVTSFKRALLDDRKFPKQNPLIQLHESTDVRFDGSKAAIEKKANDLKNNFDRWFNGIVEGNETIGLFALAPQALLIKLGTLLNDQNNVFVYQCHRDQAARWSWDIRVKAHTVQFIIKRPSKTLGKVALVIDISATVDDDRIISVLGEDVSIFHITIAEPNRNCVKNEQTQLSFIEAFRRVMEEIKASRPLPELIHIFPVMPASLAVKMGMDYMPKTDLPFLIYEQANAQTGFFEALEIGGI